MRRLVPVFIGPRLPALMTKADRFTIFEDLMSKFNQRLGDLTNLSNKLKIDHIRGHIWSGHNGHYGHGGHNGRSAIWLYGHKYGQVGCLFEGIEKCRSPV